MSFITAKTNDKMLIREFYSDESLQNALFLIDNMVGELIASLVERKTRGSALSAIWAKPYSIVWALPNPKSVWWPGMLLVGQYSTQGQFVPKPLADANYSRIPLNIRKQLLKLKPKGPSSTQSASAAVVAASTSITSTSDQCKYIFTSFEFSALL